MMTGFENIKSVYFIGVGGVGMSALARYFNSMGKNVAGYDRTPTLLTDELAAEGISIHFQDDIALVNEVFKMKQETLVVYTPAIPADHSELCFFKNQEFTLMKRAEVLGLISRSRDAICVAGTHGKTTTSGLVAHILKSSQRGCSAFLGGIANNYNTNFLYDDQSPYVVVEADEFDRSFLHLEPHLALVTSMDADHLDIYGDKNQVKEAFNAFAQKIQPGGALVAKNGLLFDEELLDYELEIFTYGVNDKRADFSAINVKLEENLYRFDLVSPFGRISDLKLGIPGLHNVENAVGASALALLCDVEEDELRAALATYLGNRRRFQYRIKHDDFVFIDDYAHHPAEVKAMIQSLRKMYDKRTLTVVFQPHLFSRTRDFAADFAEALDLADRVLLLDIYPARELPIDGVSSEMLIQKMKNKNSMVVGSETLFDEVVKHPLDLLVTMGAGNIDAMVPILEEKLLSFTHKQKGKS